MQYTSLHSPPVIHKEANNDEMNSHTYSKPYTADVICKDDEGSYTNVRMGAQDQQMTISNFSANNHVNLVKVKKIDTDNMISLDIISANCYNGKFMFSNLYNPSKFLNVQLLFCNNGKTKHWKKILTEVNLNAYATCYRGDIRFQLWTTTSSI